MTFIGNLFVSTTVPLRAWPYYWCLFNPTVALQRERARAAVSIAVVRQGFPLPLLPSITLLLPLSLLPPILDPVTVTLIQKSRDKPKSTTEGIAKGRKAFRESGAQVAEEGRELWTQTIGLVNTFQFCWGGVVFLARNGYLHESSVTYGRKELHGKATLLYHGTLAVYGANELMIASPRSEDEYLSNLLARSPSKTFKSCESCLR